MPRRRYRCSTVRCEQFGAEVTVAARPVGPFWEWPVLRCACGNEPRVVDAPSSSLDSPLMMGTG